MKSSMFVLALFILTCQSSAGKMDSWRSEQFVPYIRKCLTTWNLLFPIRLSHQISLQFKESGLWSPGFNHYLLSNKEIKNFEILMNKIESINAKQIIRNWVYLVETKMWRARHDQTKKEIEKLFDEYHGCELNQKLADLQ